MEDKKRISGLMIITIAIFILTVGGATYAYLRNQNHGKETESNAELMTYTTDSLTFNTTGDISIRANAENFEENMGNLSATAVATATLLANNKTNVSTMKYHVYIDINENTLEYTTEEQYPEMLLQVVDPDGNEITEINGLDYVVYKEEIKDAETNEVIQNKVAGFDITTKKGMFFLAYNYSITVDEEDIDHLTNQEWKVKVTLVNLDSDQEVNSNKIFDLDVHIVGNTFAEYLKKYVYGVDQTLLLHNGTMSDAPFGVIDVEDNNYRYAGPSEEVNNFVCFGSDVIPCPNDNLYRIIGIFGDQVKLIKYDYALTNLLGTDGEYVGVYPSDTSNYKGLTDVKIIPGYYFNSANGSSSTNNWAISKLNVVNLNTNYLKNIEEKWTDKIAEATWKIGGMTYTQGVTSSNIAKNNYKYELGTNSKDKTYQGKIGLMYMSDYYYATSPTYWTYYGYNSTDETKDYRAARYNNWMYMGLAEWSISPRADTNVGEYYVSGDGYGAETWMYKGVFGVRPSFYLVSSTMLLGGTGTMNDPYRIVV